MTIVGMNVAIKTSGAGLSLTDEACTDLGDDVFQVTNAAKRVLDPHAAIVVEDGGTPVDAADYELDRLFGRITFLTPPAGAVTIASGTYLPMTTVATATGYKISRKANNQDITPLSASGGFMRRTQVLKDVSGSLMRFDEADALFTDALEAAVAIVVEVAHSGAAYERAWALLDSVDNDGEADGVIEESIEWSGTTDADGRVISLA